jgi:hypothetical protein
MMGILYVWVAMFGRLLRMRLAQDDNLRSFKDKVHSVWGVPPIHQALTVDALPLTAKRLDVLLLNIGNRWACQVEPRVNLRIKGVKPLAPRAQHTLDRQFYIDLIKSARRFFRQNPRATVFSGDVIIRKQRWLRLCLTLQF